ncbi:MAG: ABC transporter permease subunit [bacterium]
MNRLAYPLFILKNHRGFLLFGALVIGALQAVIIALISTVDTASIITLLFEQLPQRFQEFINESFLVSFSVKGAAAFGLNHPFVLALLAISAIHIPNRHIAGEIESGTLELMLAQPFERTRLLLWLWFSGGVLLLGIISGGLLGSLSALAATDNLSGALLIKMLQIAANLWMLFVFIMSYTLLMATFSGEGSKIGMQSAGVTFLFFFLYLFSTLWDGLKFTQPFNFFSYYQPQKLMFGQQSFGMNVCVLSGLIAISLFISVRQFNRRDIPG